MDINKAWIVIPLFFIILSATTTYSASYLKPGSAYFGDADHPELDYSEMYENSTFVSTSMIDVTSMNTDIGGIKFLGIEMPDIFSPARDLYTILNAGLNVPIVIGNALGLEESFTKTIVAIMGILCLLGFLFFLRGTV